MIIMFQERFAEAVRTGAKCQTIRPLRKRPITVGQPLSLRKWSGKAYRSKQVELANGMCIGVEEIEISEHGVIVDDEGRGPSGSLQEFAVADGFESWGHMRDWFQQTHGLPFNGVLIRWSVSP